MIDRMKEPVSLGGYLDHDPDRPPLFLLGGNNPVRNWEDPEPKGETDPETPERPIEDNLVLGGLAETITETLPQP